MCKTDELEDRQDLIDRIEGLQADLGEAVSVAIRRGALDWARLNYPDHPDLKSGSKASLQGVALVRSAFKSVEVDLQSRIREMRNHLEEGGSVYMHLEQALSDTEVQFEIDRHCFAADILKHAAENYEGEAGHRLEATLEGMALDVATAERQRCMSAVGSAWAKVEGTPYYTGPRKFCDAIRNMPPVSETVPMIVKELF